MLKPTVFFQYIMTMWKIFSNPQKLKLRGVMFASRLGLETDVRESKTVLDSGFHALDSKFQLLDFRSFLVELGSWIPIVSGIPDSYSCIPDSINKNFQDSGISIPNPSEQELRPIHTTGFAPGACSRLILHGPVQTRERFQVRSICPGILLPNI